MLKMLSKTAAGKDVVILGLSAENLSRLPDAPIHIKGADLKIGVDIVLYDTDFGVPKRRAGFMFIGIDKAAVDKKLIHVQDAQLPIDLILFAGESEQQMMRDVAELIGPDSDVKIDPRLRD